MVFAVVFAVVAAVALSLVQPPRELHVQLNAGLPPAMAAARLGEQSVSSDSTRASTNDGVSENASGSVDINFDIDSEPERADDSASEPERAPLPSEDDNPDPVMAIFNFHVAIFVVMKSGEKSKKGVRGVCRQSVGRHAQAIKESFGSFKKK